MIDNLKRKKTKKEVIIITIGSILILILAMFLCFKSIKGKDSYIMHYSDSSKLDYNVYLKKNNFYTTPYLPKDRMYVANIIDYIDTYFDYNFEVVEDINLGYKYYISAKVVVDGTSNKKIFDKEEILVDKTDVQQINDKKFSISENVKIDYNKYNQLASSFIDEYGISAKANIIVGMYVDVEGTHERFEKKLNDNAVVSFEIPLTTELTEIKMNYDLTNNANEVFEYGKTSITHPLLFTVTILIAVVDIAIAVFEITRYIINKDVKTRYQEKLKKIFRDYGNYISKKSVTAKTKEIMYTMSLRVEIVNSFDDLINVRDNLEKPILFYESVPGEQAVFYIIDTKVSYIYIMNARDLEKKNKNKEIKKTTIFNEKEEISNNDILDSQTTIDSGKENIENTPVVEDKIEETFQNEDDVLIQEETITLDEQQNIETIEEALDESLNNESETFEPSTTVSNEKDTASKKNKAKVYRRRTRRSNNRTTRNYKGSKNKKSE